MKENIVYSVHNIDIDCIEDIESIASDAEPIIVRERRMVYYLFCNLSNKYSFIIDVKGEKIGFILCQINDNRNEIWIHQIAVLTRFRNKGIGSKLLNKLIKVAKKDKFERVRLAVKPNNKAHGLYERSGFKLLKFDDLINMNIMEIRLVVTLDNDGITPTS